VREGESQLQAYHVSQIIKHGGGAIFAWDCMTSCGMKYTCKMHGMMIQALNLIISQDGVRKIIDQL
jgi:hypothetical protein